MTPTCLFQTDFTFEKWMMTFSNQLKLSLNEKKVQVKVIIRISQWEKLNSILITITFLSFLIDVYEKIDHVTWSFLVEWKCIFDKFLCVCIQTDFNIPLSQTFDLEQWGLLQVTTVHAVIKAKVSVNCNVYSFIICNHLSFAGSQGFCPSN